MSKNQHGAAVLSNHIGDQSALTGAAEDPSHIELLEGLFDAIAEPVRWPSVLNGLPALLGFPLPPVSTNDLATAPSSRQDICRNCSAARTHFLNWATAVSNNNGHRRLRAVRRQVERAAALCSRMVSIQAQNTASLQALDRFDRGLLFVDSGRKVVFANSLASEILKQHDGIYLSCGRLRASRLEDSILLRNMIQNAVMATEKSQQSESMLRISRLLPHRALNLVITSTALRSGCPDNRPLAGIIVFDPDRDMHIDPSSLRGPYGLTKSEAALSVKLLTGKSLATAAAELRISIETARTHLKRIFLKTGTNRQQQLVAMMLNHPL